ncbi:MAG: hypothetical protein Q4C53_08300 [Clostridia bacterium]|nr:hypothetical protein [Clostridia bacterium]
MRGSERMRRNVFRLGCVLLFLAMTVLFCISATYTLRPNHENTRVRMENFYAAPKDSLDVVIVGSSAAYAFFSPLRLYGQTGLTSAVYATPNLSVPAIRICIEECRKTQPDATYVIELRAVLSDDEARGNTETDFRRLTDMMPLSHLREEAIRSYVPEEDRMQVRFDLMKYHGRWKEATLSDLRLTWGKTDPMRGWIFDTGVFPLTEYTDCSAVNARISPDPQSETELRELLAWCKVTGVDARFVVTPFACARSQAKIYNSVADIVKEYGFPWLNLLRESKHIGLDPLTDFSDTRHVNQMGAVKCTDRLAAWLKDDAAAKEHRDKAAWDKDLAAYEEREAAALAALSETTRRDPN